MVAAATHETKSSERAISLKVIDCDAHVTEPPDLWTARAPASMKGRVPVHRTVDDRTMWYLGGKPWSSIGGNTVSNGRQKVLGTFSAQPFAAVDPSTWSTPHRLALLDDIGIFAQILYPNGIGFSSNHIFAVEDEQDRIAILRMYNDFLVDTQAESSGRLFPQALIPIWDMKQTVAEMERLLAAGIRGFTLSDRPEMLDLPELHDPYFEPMWDLFNESGAVVNFHIGSGRSRAESELGRAVSEGRDPVTDAVLRDVPQPKGTAQMQWNCFGLQRSRAVRATQHYVSNLRIIVNLCMSDLFDRFPKLRVVSAESGIGWIPFVLESLEFQFDEMVVDPDEVGFTKRRPSEYFREHIYVMFWFEKVAVQKLIEDIGIYNVLAETDFPHPVSLYPGAVDHFIDVTKDLSPYVRQRVLQDNAAELYRIPLS